MLHNVQNSCRHTDELTQGEHHAYSKHDAYERTGGYIIAQLDMIYELHEKKGHEKQQKRT